jgi:septal ring factor EnvC (AmiA/AmiB activator)
MFRRMRLMREYASYQHVQGDEVKVQQEAVNRKREELNSVKTQKKTLLAKDEQERKSLEDKQTEQQNVVKTLQNEQRNIQNIIAQQKKKDAELNAQIDRLIAEEIARQKARAAAEAKRREAAKRKAEAAKKRQEEQARKPSTTRKGGSKSRKEETYVPAEEKEEALMMSSEDRRISGSFESNRGRLPIPITGSYRIVSHFGQYNVDGLRNVKLDNKGIHIKGESGAKARSIFDGEVSAVFSFGGTMVVMVRHGSYISVYCNLSSVSVHHGQKVSTRQVLGTIGHDNILQFQLRRETAKLNPERWLGR